MNEVGRCLDVLPALAVIGRHDPRPIALIDLGTGAGLGLHLDRYGYRYQLSDGSQHSAGDPESPVQLRCEVRAGPAPPLAVQMPTIIDRVGIDIPHGVLGVPPTIKQTGWWKDGASPGARAGSILIAGHVDNATGAIGAFFKLHEASPGDTITVTARGGRTFSYRVLSVRTYLKRNLPPDVYSRKGRPRLVLVTCGGPFIQSTGHYRDNIVLTAVPA